MRYFLVIAFSLLAFSIDAKDKSPKATRAPAAISNEQKVQMLGELLLPTLEGQYICYADCLLNGAYQQLRIVGKSKKSLYESMKKMCPNGLEHDVGPGMFKVQSADEVCKDAQWYLNTFVLDKR